MLYTCIIFFTCAEQRVSISTNNLSRVRLSKRHKLIPGRQEVTTLTSLIDQPALTKFQGVITTKCNGNQTCALTRRGGKAQPDERGAP